MVVRPPSGWRPRPPQQLLVLADGATSPTPLCSFARCAPPLIISPVRDTESFSECFANCVALLFFFRRLYEKACLVKGSSEEQLLRLPPLMCLDCQTCLSVHLRPDGGGGWGSSQHMAEKVNIIAALLADSRDYENYICLVALSALLLT